MTPNAPLRQFIASAVAAGQFFTNFLPEVHVLQSFDDDLAVEWSAAMDYGYSHYTVILLCCLPFLQRDPASPADVLKTNPNDEGLGGDDAADALRYLLATRRPTIVQRKLRGL